METYHARFENSDLKHGQTQIEMFLKLYGPDLSNTDTLITRTMAEQTSRLFYLPGHGHPISLKYC